MSGGRFFKLSSRCFTETCPYQKSDLGRRSPRIFKELPNDLDLSGGFFKDAVVNSFPGEHERVLFLIKFYQCLLAGQLPIKTRKLTLVGDRNSGKTSLVNVLEGLTHPEFFSTISKEKVFGMSMIHSDTQVIFLDEFSDEILPADQAKVLLQGGMVTIPRKHADPELIVNKAGEFFFALIFTSFFFFLFCFSLFRQT